MQNNYSIFKSIDITVKLLHLYCYTMNIDEAFELFIPFKCELIIIILYHLNMDYLKSYYTFKWELFVIILYHLNIKYLKSYYIIFIPFKYGLDWIINTL